MLTLKEIRFQGLGRFVDEQSISFDSLGNLIQLGGQNNNTGGSSGAAKSTVLNAISFLLGLNKVPNSILQSRLTKEPMWVEGTFDFDGLPLTIYRGKKLKITLDGEVTEGSSKISEEKLDQILSIPRHLFKPMLHKEQGERGFFLNFTPKQTNDFLTDCLGLSSFKTPLLATEGKIQKLVEKSNEVSSAFLSAEAGLKVTQATLNTMEAPPVKEMDQETILSHKASLDLNTKELETLSQIHAKELAAFELTRPTQVHIKFDMSARVELEERLRESVSKRNSFLLAQKDLENKAQVQIQSLKHKQSDLLRHIDTANSAKSEASRLADKVKKLRESKCHTCGQDWANEQAKKEEGLLLDNINKLKILIVAGTQAEVDYAITQKELEAVQVPPFLPNEYQEHLTEALQIQKLIDENVRQEYVHNDSVNTTNFSNQLKFNEALHLLKDKHSAAEAFSRDQIEAYKRALESSVLKLKAYEEARVRHETSVARLTRLVEECQEQFNTASQQLKSITSEIESYEELKKAIKSYLSCSFDEALLTISENATRLVRAVPNMANATVQLTGVWETKEGKVKEEVNAVINLDGDENVDIRSLCGGERSAIDLAVDLAVIDLIESKTNKGINIMLLDEPFTGLDTVCIEMALEVLKSASASKKLIIIDHNPEIRQMVESSLVVIRDGLTSKVCQN